MNPSVLMPPVPGRPLILYMTVLDELMGCMLGQHDESGKRERVIYYFVLLQITIKTDLSFFATIWSQ